MDDSVVVDHTSQLSKVAVATPTAIFNACKRENGAMKYHTLCASSFLRLPVMKSLEGCKHLPQREKRVPVVAKSRFHSVHDSVDGEEKGSGGPQTLCVHV